MLEAFLHLPIQDQELQRMRRLPQVTPHTRRLRGCQHIGTSF